MDDAFGSGTVDDRDGDVFFAGDGFLDFGFDARFGDLVTQLAFGALAKAFLRGWKVGHDSFCFLRLRLIQKSTWHILAG